MKKDTKPRQIIASEELELRAFIKKRLKEIRTLSDITQSYLAGRLGKNRSIYASWEAQSHATIPSIYWLKMICNDIYGIPLDKFLDSRISSEELFSQYVQQNLPDNL